MSQSLYLIMKASCDDEFADPQPHFALTRIRPPDIQGMIAKVQRVERFCREEEDSIWTISYWDCRLAWVSELPWEDTQEAGRLCLWPLDLVSGQEMQDRVEADDFVFALGEADLPRDLACRVATECETLDVRKDALAWSGHIKHAGCHINTVSPQTDDLGEVARLLEERQGFARSRQDR